MNARNSRTLLGSAVAALAMLAFTVQPANASPHYSSSRGHDQGRYGYSQSSYSYGSGGHGRRGSSYNESYRSSSYGYGNTYSDHSRPSTYGHRSNVRYYRPQHSSRRVRSHSGFSFGFNFSRQRGHTTRSDRGHVSRSYRRSHSRRGRH